MTSMSAAEWDERYSGADLVWSATPNRWVEQEVEQEAAALPPGRALDLACGEGRNSIWLAQRGWQVTGVDFSAQGLAKAERLAGSQHPPVSVDWIQADVTTFTPTHPYDLVLLVYLQLASPARGAAVRLAWQALAPGGTLIVIAHHSDNLTEGVGGPQDPTVLYTEQDVLDDLAGDGPRPVVERAERVERPVAGAGRPALDVLVRLRKP